MLTNLRNTVERRKGERNRLRKLSSQLLKSIVELKEDDNTFLKCQVILQDVVGQIQKNVKFQINNLVTVALKSVFPDNPYKFILDFVNRRGKTECDIFFKRGGIRFDPLSESGGGVVDVAAFALRIAMWSLSGKYDNVLVFDEPFKNINDETRETHRRVAELVKELSHKLNLQFIIITMLSELQEVSDKNFKFRLKGKVTKCSEI
jgi:DNA repair exonuclease SbcCD ATPase subunit